jgi:hypothetical protein
MKAVNVLPIIGAFLESMDHNCAHRYDIERWLKDKSPIVNTVSRQEYYDLTDAQVEVVLNCFAMAGIGGRAMTDEPLGGYYHFEDKPSDVAFDTCFAVLDKADKDILRNSEVPILFGNSGECEDLVRRLNKGFDSGDYELLEVDVIRTADES